VLAALYVWGLTQNEEHLEEFKSLCEDAGVDSALAVTEANSSPDFFRVAVAGNINRDMYPQITRIVKYFRSSHKFESVLKRKMQYGVKTMKEFGNLYTGSLPAWIAAGIEEAYKENIDITRKAFLTIGYGSGDAAEAMMIYIADDWRQAAAQIGVNQALEGAIDLSKDEYEALHDGLSEPCPAYEPSEQFIVDRIGDHSNGYQDLGIEYYRFVLDDGDIDPTSDSEMKVG
jgi:hydroxymethylglutaryl-CoA synthase